MTREHSPGLIAELGRRNVIRMAGLYLVGAWLVVQVGSTLLPMFGAPAWLPRSIVIVLALGFIPALVFAWVFEITVDGIKRDSEVAPGHSIAPQTARRMDRMIIAVLLLALVYFGFDRLVLAPRRDAALVATTTQTVQAKSGARATPDVARNSIAVLPFVNMSGDAANEYFSDGISEEILNVLAGTPELKVAARTSSFAFKGKTMEVPAIARELRVRMVLEGSVRKQGDTVRITAQLIDAQSGFHVWSETYDRKLEDIFAIQDEIAKAIGDELKVKIVAADGQSAGGTKNVQAYDLYLRGLAKWQTRNVDNLLAARKLFEQAIALDPTFAQGWAGLALVYAVLPDYTPKVSYSEAASLGREAAMRALLIDPTLPEPYAVLSGFEKYEQHWPTAIALLERAIELRPSYATPRQWLGTALVPIGEVEKGLASLKRAQELDPRSLIVASNYASMLHIAGRDDEAIAACRPTLEFAPDSLLCTSVMAVSYLAKKDMKSARRYYDLVAAAWTPGSSVPVKTLFDALEGRAEGHALAARLSEATSDQWNDPAQDLPFANSDIPVLLVLLGEQELVFRFIERQPSATMWTLSWGLLSPLMDPVRCDPRFVAVLAKARLRDLRAEKMCAGRG